MEQDSPEAVGAALSRAREASAGLARRSVRERSGALGQLLDELRTPGSAPRVHLEQELPAATGFSPAVVARGLALALEPLAGAAFVALAEHELGEAPLRAPASTSVVLAGALPTPTILQLLAPLAVGSAIVVKPATHDPVTPIVVRDALRKIDAQLGCAIELVRFPRDATACTQTLCSADCVVVTGSDEAVAAHRARVAPGRHFVASGHRFSVGVLDPTSLTEAELERAAYGFALDVALWDQLGCLSPVALFVLGTEAVPEPVATALAHAFDAIDRELPRGEVPLRVKAASSQARDAAAMRAAGRAEGEAGRAEGGAATRVHRGRGGSTLVFEADTALRTSPLHRFVHVHPAATPEAMLEALAPARAHLAGVSLAGVAPDATLVERLGRLGASRVCQAGALQAPPLDWQREGRPVLGSLLLPT